MHCVERKIKGIGLNFFLKTELFFRQDLETRCNPVSPFYYLNLCESDLSVRSLESHAKRKRERGERGEREERERERERRERESSGLVKKVVIF
jgi:hypothetical protein